MFAGLVEGLESHADHEWAQIGRCIYCVTCKGARLYQGTIPRSHTNVRARPGRREPKETTDMRARWDMDGR